MFPSLYSVLFVTCKVGILISTSFSMDRSSSALPVHYIISNAECEPYNMEALMQNMDAIFIKWPAICTMKSKVLKYI